MVWLTETRQRALAAGGAQYPSPLLTALHVIGDELGHHPLALAIQSSQHLTPRQQGQLLRAQQLAEALWEPGLLPLP